MGGLTNVFNYSLKTETVFVDVSSLYPSVMNEEVLPCEYLETIQFTLSK